MSDKLQQATSLVSQHKYKKALTLLKKLNSKSKDQSFISLEAEGVCLYHLKKYPLAEMTFEKSLNKASNDKERLNALNNLKSSAFHANQKERCIEYLKKIITIDGSLNTAPQRFELCKLAFLQGQFSIVTDYVTKLTALSEYAVEGGLLAVSAYAELSDTEHMMLALNKLMPDLDKVSNLQMNELFAVLYRCEQTDALAKLVVAAEDKFAHQKWYQDVVGFLEAEESVTAEKIDAVNEKPLERVVGQSKEIVDTITSILSLLESQGAVFHPDLRFVEHQGNLSIQSFAQDQEKLIQVPMQTMPLLNDYDFKVNAGQLECVAKNDGKNPGANKMMHLLVCLYNQTQKVESWNQCHPFLTLKEHLDFLQQFLSKSAKIPKLASYFSLLEEKQWQALFLKTFFGSREFDFTQEALGKVGIVTENTAEKALLTVIDFLNHNSNAEGYVVDKQSLMMEIKPSGANESHELFVKYNHIDAVIAYFIYGFVDTQSSILYSCETSLTRLNGGVIHIQGSAGLANAEDMGDAKHLHQFIPARIQRADNTLILNSFIIPSRQAANTLEQVLKYVLLKFDLEGEYQDEQHLIKEIKHLERQLIVDNLVMWKQRAQEVEQLLASDQSISGVTQRDLPMLCRTCIEHIEAYQAKVNMVLI